MNIPECVSEKKNLSAKINDKNEHKNTCYYWI